MSLSPFPRKTEGMKSKILISHTILDVELIMKHKINMEAVFSKILDKSKLSMK
jgi:hypothetical protein